MLKYQNYLLKSRFLPLFEKLSFLMKFSLVGLCLTVFPIFGSEWEPLQKGVLYLRSDVYDKEGFSEVYFRELGSSFFKKTNVDKGERKISSHVFSIEDKYDVMLKNDKDLVYLEYQTIKEGVVRVDVLDLYGKKLMTLVNVFMAPGIYRIDNGPSWEELVTLKGFIILTLSINESPVFSKKILK